MDSGQAERLIKVLTQIRDRMPAAATTPEPPGEGSYWISAAHGVRDDLWLSIRNGVENQLINAEDVPASLLDGDRLDRIADGVRGKVEMDRKRT